ncbi:hypothetical protein LAWI1_G007138 [Lachnellula willkommii]|uniref:Uncharacterized protein n=1 Tax=Lachnellula willkommii TaxID=215461 RepID=A0A559M2A3_9HELO|nr:hypothetical protein LAWI1_G007138 [Lachnellula willkommii]
MTAAVSLRLTDEEKKPLKAQILLYHEARLPFDTKAAAKKNTGMYLECEYFSRSGYVSPGMQPIDYLKAERCPTSSQLHLRLRSAQRYGAWSMEAS